MTNTKNKNQDALKERSSHNVLGVSPDAGRESMVGKIYGRRTFWAGSERVHKTAVHRRRQLWNTGARDPSTANNLILSVNFRAAQSLTATSLRLPLCILREQLR